MAGLSRYNVSGDQAGVKDGVLINQLGIKSAKKLSRAETILLDITANHFIEALEKKRLTFNLELLFDIHRHFLGKLYSWAGQLRTVDISKDGMLFCPAVHLEENLKPFEKLLQKGVPTKKDSKREIARKLALIHNEFNALHPFREGNGRTIRLFLDLMAVSLGYRQIKYKQTEKKAYFAACRAGMNTDHEKMEQIIFKGLTKR